MWSDKSGKNAPFAESTRLFERAAQVIPGGIYGHTTPANLVPGSMPYFARRAAGCRYEDVDGNSYIDYMCGYGPIVLGYNHPEVEEAAERQRRDGNCFNHPGEVFVQLAERLVSLVDFADWAVFGKNGADMTTWALMVAREFTGRKKILTLKGSYHGTHAWCTPGHGGVIEEDLRHIHSFEWNNLESFHDMLKRHPGQFAAVFVSPFHHPLYKDSVLPAPGFFEEIEAVCKREGILLVLDDIRAGFRLNLGGSHRHFGFTPDLICFCKALGNGHPISAALGGSRLRKAATSVFLTGSYWNSAVPMAASLKCLEILERDRVVEKLDTTGRLLARGLEDAAAKHGLTITMSGPPAVPFLTFSNEKNLYRNQLLAVEMAKRGVFFHPHHNWFLSAAHEPAEIEETLRAANDSFAVVKQTFGS